MKIYFGDLNIARGLHYHESPLDFKIVIRKQIQSVPLIRSDVMKQFDRGNVKIEVSFSIVRKHASIADATYYTLSHPAEIKSTQGPILLINEHENLEASFILENGAIQFIESSIAGSVSNHRYEFVGTHFSKQPPSDL